MGLVLMGGGDYINLGDSVINNCANGCSFSFWFKKVGAGYTQIGRWDTTSNNRFFYFGNPADMDTDYYIDYDGGNDAGDTCGASYTGSDISYNVWYNHIVVYHNMTGVGNISVYRNGIVLTSTACAWSGINVSAWQDAESTLIGAADDDSPQNYFNGSIDDVMIFNTSLTEAQILGIYQNQSARYLSRGLQTPVGVKITNDTTWNNDGFNRLNLTMNISNQLGSNVSVRIKQYNVSVNTTGLVLYMPFEEATPLDMSGNSIVGTINGNAYWNDTGGRNNTGGFSFDGNGDYIDFGKVDETEGVAGLAVSAWVKSATGLKVPNELITNKDEVFLFAFDAGENVEFRVYNASTSAQAAYNDGILDTNWHHVLVYVDTIMGEDSVPELTGLTNTGENYNLLIGTIWNGTIDDVMIFNRSLSSAEIQALYTNQSSKHDNVYYSDTQVFTTQTMKQFTINPEADLITPEFTLNANNYSFTTPLLKDNIILDAWSYEEAGEDLTPPTVTLVHPPAGYYNDTLAYTLFNCTSTDPSGIFNISLWLTNPTNSSFGFNATNSSSEILNTMNATYNLSTGNYTWNCYACDILNNCGFASANRTVEMRPLYVPPADSCTPTAGQNWRIEHNCTKSNWAWAMPTYHIDIVNGSLILNGLTNLTAKYINISGLINPQTRGYPVLNISPTARYNRTGNP
jgi:hypothetical protein